MSGKQRGRERDFDSTADSSEDPADAVMMLIPGNPLQNSRFTPS